MLVPYEEYNDEFGYYRIRKLGELTGRWKLAKNTRGYIEVYIEVKGRFFSRRWIHENRITWKEEMWEIINECSR